MAQCSSHNSPAQPEAAADVSAKPAPNTTHKIRRFCNWVFSRKPQTVEAQQNQDGDDSSPQSIRLTDGEAEQNGNTESNACFSIVEQDAAAAASPPPREKKLRRFCKWLFSRKPKTVEAQQNQDGDDSRAQPQRRADGEAEQNGTSIVKQDAASPPPKKAGKKIKRFCKWVFSRKSKAVQSQDADDSGPQPQRSNSNTEGISTSHVPVAAPVCSSTKAVQDKQDADEGIGTHSTVSSPDKAEETAVAVCSSPRQVQDVQDDNEVISTSVDTEEQKSVTCVSNLQICLSSLKVSQDVDTNIPGEEQAGTVAPPVHSDGSAPPVAEEKSSAPAQDDLAWKTDDEIINLRLKGSTGDINEHYEVGERLGRGSYGFVSNGTRLSDSQKVAIKVVEKTEDLKTVRIGLFGRKIPREVAMMVLLNNGPAAPQIIKLLDWYDTPDSYILVLEQPTPCEDMRKFLLLHDRKVKESVARAVMRQVVTAARICCERGIFHGDIKLENILINRNTLQIKLIDFGTSRRLNKSAYSTFSGTRAYAPPEWAHLQRHHGNTSTVYSLGVLLYRMLFGEFPGKKLPEIVAKTWCADEISKQCRDLICSCLERDAADRIPMEKIILHGWFQNLILD